MDALLHEEEAQLTSSASKASKKKKKQQLKSGDEAGGSSSSRGDDVDSSAASMEKVMKEEQSSSAIQETIGSTTEAPAATTDAADRALRQAVDSGDLEALSRALEAHHISASPEEVANARSARDRLKEKRRKESQKQRRAHGAMMMQDEELHLPVEVAVKKAIYAEPDHTDLDRELEVLKRCRHAHLLPLLGYCRDLQSPCLIFPLMSGGSLEARLRLTEDDLATLRSMGHFTTAPPKMLTWAQRLRIVIQASSALLHLHVLGCVHRDFKPANILLQADLHAMLSDTGFAKAAADGDSSVGATKHASMTGRGAVHTTGYADPLIVSSGEYSAKTDAYAVGVTLLVCLTERAAEGIFDNCENDLDADFEDIDPLQLVEPRVAWPSDVARAIVPLILSKEHESSLCTPKKRKRCDLAVAIERLTALLPKQGGGGGGGGGAAAAASARAAEADGAAAVAHDGNAAEAAGVSSLDVLAPSDASRLVRKLGRAAASSDDAVEKVRRLQQKASEGFRHVMGRLANIYTARAAEGEAPPDDFKERIDYWRDQCRLPNALHDKLHRLRIWRNASEHGNEERWRREGPKDEEELVQLLSACDGLASKLDRPVSVS